jgi:hypothetical protein
MYVRTRTSAREPTLARYARAHEQNIKKAGVRTSAAYFSRRTDANKHAQRVVAGELGPFTHKHTHAQNRDTNTIRTYDIKAGEGYSTPRCTNARTRTKSTAHTNHANAHKRLLAHTLSCELDSPCVPTHTHTHTHSHILATCSQHARTAHDVLSNTAQSNVNTQRRTTLHITRAPPPPPRPLQRTNKLRVCRHAILLRQELSTATPAPAGGTGAARRSVRRQSQRRHPRKQRRRTRAHAYARTKLSPLSMANFPACAGYGGRRGGGHGSATRGRRAQQTNAICGHRHVRRPNTRVIGCRGQEGFCGVSVSLHVCQALLRVMWTHTRFQHIAISGILYSAAHQI